MPNYSSYPTTERPSMEDDSSRSRIEIHDLLRACANQSRDVEDISAEILHFAKSDASPDAPVLSDLLLDTLFLYDTGVSCDDEAVLAIQRQHLGQLISKLIAGNCVAQQDAYERLDAPLLSAAGLIPDAKAFEKRHVRINTNLLYKQQKFNLFREDNEGYSKLIVEFDAFLMTTKNAESENDARQLLTSIQSLIGYFDLDPNRVLDVLIELVAQNLLTHWRFLLLMLKLSPWFVEDERKSDAASNSRGGLDQRYGNRAAAQIIGFKFQQVKQSDHENESLSMLAALLIKEGLLKLQDLWPHLAPEDSVLAKERSAYQERVLEEVDKAKGRNALALAGGLDDEPGQTGDTSQAPAVADEDKDISKEDNQQKIALLYSLLCIGALPESLFVLSEFSFLLNSHRHLATAFTELVEYMIEPLWEGLRPQQNYSTELRASLYQLKRVPEELKYRDSALILPVPATIYHVLDPRQNRRDAQIQEVFFYDQVHSQLASCRSYHDFESAVLPCIRLAGVQLNCNVKLCTKIARIGRGAIQASSEPEATRQQWQSVLRACLLPALSLLDTNPAIVSDIFNLISEYTTEQRYSMYGEWFTDSYRKIPELKVQFVKTEKETKSLLRRISKTNTKEYGRRLAKASHSNPCIVLNIALNQIESYDNLVDVVIEASRYFTLLTFDVLVFVMLTLLSNTQKRRLKEDGTSVAHWLQSLSSFTAKIFKRYSHMDPSPIATYVAKQLKMNNAFDLIILRDLINEMAGLRPSSDLSEEQLQGCAGGPCLRVEALLLINERRESSAKVPLRLLYALDKAKLTYALPILIGQQRTKCVFQVPEEQSLLKLLANLADEVHQILIQYLEYLSINTTTEQYAASIPSIPTMVLTHSLEPCVAFMIARPAISAAIQEHFRLVKLPKEQTPVQSTTLDAQAEQGVAENLSDDKPNEPSKLAEDTSDTKDVPMVDVLENVSDEDSQSSGGSNYSIPPVLIQLTESTLPILPASAWQAMSSAFYTTFWSLSLYDLVVPVKRYEKEARGLQRQIAATGSDELDNKTKDIYSSRMSALTTEMSEQSHNARIVKHMFESESQTWCSSTSQRNNESACAILQHCLLPRCLISPNDAIYCSEFLVMLHPRGVPGLNLMHLYELIFNSHLATTIFCCTEREAENFGRFLGRTLERLNAISAEEGFFDDFMVLADNTATPDESKSREFTYSKYKTIWYDAFHRSIWTNVKACFESSEYMHIRNILIVLEKMQAAFPYFKWIGKNIEKEVDKLISTERREDLKIRALGYKAVLKRQQAKWHEAPGKAPVPPSNSAPSEARLEHEADSTDSSKINPATDHPDSSAKVNSDPEVVPSEPASVQALDVQPQVVQIGQAQLSLTPEEQKERAKQKAASLSQQLKERSEISTRTESETVKTKAELDHVSSDSHTDKVRARERSSRPNSRGSSPRRGERNDRRELKEIPSHVADRSTKSNVSGGPPGDKSQEQRSSDSRMASSDRSLHEHANIINHRKNFDNQNHDSGGRHGRMNDTQQRRADFDNHGRLSSERNGGDERRRPTRGQEVRSTASDTRSARSATHEAPIGPRSDTLKDRLAAQPQSRLSPIARTAPAERHHDRSSDGQQERNREQKADEQASYRTRRGHDAPDNRATRTDSQEETGGAARRLPDRLRQPISNNGSDSRQVRVNSAGRGPAEYVHPDRATSSQTTSNSTRAPVAGRTPDSNRPRSAVTRSVAEPEPAVHPSRLASVQGAQSERNREADHRAARNSGSLTGQSDGTLGGTQQANNVDGHNQSIGRGAHTRNEMTDTRSARNSNTVDMHGSRDNQSYNRDSRGAGRGDARPTEKSDDRDLRNDRNQGRGEIRRGLPDRAPRNDSDTKRRYPGDQRDSQRAAKRRQ